MQRHGSRFAMSCCAALLVLLLVAACSRSTARNERIMIGVSTLRISLPVFVAAEQKLFAKHGLDVELRRFDTAQPLADELNAGRLDAGGYLAFPIVDRKSVV